MTPASILLAFLAIMAPGVVVFIGLRWLTYCRDKATREAQDKEMREHDERHKRMAEMRQIRSMADRSASAAKDRKPGLRAVPTPARRDDTPAVSTSLSDNWPTYSFDNTSITTAAPAAGYSGGGGSFDGGGTSGDWGGSSSSSDSCSSSDSGSSDSGSCGSGD